MRSSLSASMKMLSLSLVNLSVLVACSAPDQEAIQTDPDVGNSINQEYYIANHSDLVSAGLGLSGLRTPPPAVAEDTTPENLRALAFHTHYNGLSALNFPDGLGAFHDTALPVVPGREISTWRQLNGSTHRSRVLLQIPDTFQPQEPCLVVAPASGSRGIYGAAPLVAPWALPKGCAVVYTDKGAGTDYFDLSTGTGVDLRGQRRSQGTTTIGFRVEAGPSDEGAMTALVATAHAHSQINVEQFWGEYTLDAVRWAHAYLSQAEGVSSTSPIKTIAAGLSNGGQAVLRALEADDDGLLDAVVAVMPNITPPNTPSLYEYAATAALAQPCLLSDAAFSGSLPFANPLLIAFGANRCQSLFQAGLIDAATPVAARQWLESIGFDEDSFTFSASIVALDIWRTVLVNYASAYMKTPYDQMPCGFAFDGSQASPEQKTQWWATGSGSPPHPGIVLVDSQINKHPTDPHFAGLLCLYNMKEEPTLVDSINAIRAQANWARDIPVFITHGQLDALIPANLSSRPYVAQALEAGLSVQYDEVPGAQHFDAFLNLLPQDQGWTPILPHGWAALDLAWHSLHEPE